MYDMGAVGGSDGAAAFSFEFSAAGKDMASKRAAPPWQAISSFRLAWCSALSDTWRSSMSDERNCRWHNTQIRRVASEKLSSRKTACCGKGGIGIDAGAGVVGVGAGTGAGVGKATLGIK